MKSIKNNLTEEPKHNTIKNWREDERPRERLLNNGASTLSDAELIAIIIRDGTVGKSALDIARELLGKFENLTNISSRDYSEFKQIKGLGQAKALTLSAVFEIAKRIQSEPFKNSETIKTPDEIAKLYIPKLRGLKTEIFRVILLNTKNAIIREEIISQGTLNSTIVHAREVFKIAIAESAASIILLHNHPSGNPEPSTEDILLTRELINAGKILNIKVFDHLIIAGETYRSLFKMGLI